MDYLSEFNCYWELAAPIVFAPVDVVSNQIDEMMQKCIVNESETDDVDFTFEDEFSIFKFSLKHIDQDPCKDFVDYFMKTYLPEPNLNEIDKMVDLLKIYKSNRLLATLDPNDRVDLKIYAELLQQRNEIIKKHGINQINVK